MRRAARIVFGAHGQLAVGIVTFVGAIVAWIYGSTLRGEALVRFIFHASMAALVIAAYAIVATALGYRATERVEAHVVEQAETRIGDGPHDTPFTAPPPPAKPARPTWGP